MQFWESGATVKCQFPSSKESTKSSSFVQPFSFPKFGLPVFNWTPATQVAPMKTVFAIVATLAFVAAFVAAEDPVAKDNAAETKVDAEPEDHHGGGNYGYRGNYGGRRYGGNFGGRH
ncbi:hypothetical protein V7S43_007873 [Phytophthora oleae]|uniref:Uncharacterized protein n=1 Tax=Phytophthora oleae TaxID=2107226 RepID=A0ABD3FMG5_9STRA